MSTSAAAQQDGSSYAGVVFDIDDLDVLKAALSCVPPEMAAQAVSHGG